MSSSLIISDFGLLFQASRVKKSWFGVAFFGLIKNGVQRAGSALMIDANRRTFSKTMPPTDIEGPNLIFF